MPGIDVLFVGPSDLSIALSDGTELDPHSAEVEAALDKIVAAAQEGRQDRGALLRQCRARDAPAPSAASASSRSAATRRSCAPARRPQVKTLKG